MGFRRFLYHPDNSYPPIVISAGHGTPEKGCFIETKILRNGKLLCINAREFKVFHSKDGLDYSYSYLNDDVIKSGNKEKADIEIINYIHRFFKAKENEEYGFAVSNNYELIRDGDSLCLPRYCCYEIGLKLVKQDENINYFKTLGQIQNHEYYKGASGSPVSDPEGRITGILVGGTDPIEHLRVFRLDNIDWQSNLRKV